MFQPVFPLALVAKYFNLGVAEVHEWISDGKLFAYHVNGTSDFVVPLVPLVRLMKFRKLAIPAEVQELYTGRILLVSDNEMRGEDLEEYVDQQRIQVRRVNPRDNPDVSFRPDFVLLDLDFEDQSLLQAWVDAFRSESEIVPHFISFEAKPGENTNSLDHVNEQSGGSHFFTSEHCQSLSDEVLRWKYRRCHRIVKCNLVPEFSWVMDAESKTALEVQTVFTTEDFVNWIEESKEWVSDRINTASTYAHPVVGTSQYVVPPDPLREEMNLMCKHDFPEALGRSQTGNILVVSRHSELVSLFQQGDDCLLYRIWHANLADVQGAWPRWLDCVVIECSEDGEELVNQWIERLKADDNSHPPRLVAVCLDPGHPLTEYFTSCLTVDQVGRDLVYYATNAAMRSRNAL